VDEQDWSGDRRQLHHWFRALRNHGERAGQYHGPRAARYAVARA
jgi:hypothetical protein